MKICVTGKIGSGKTTFINIAKDTKCNVFVADDFINETYKIGKPGFKKIIKEFGINLSNGSEIDKKKLLEVLLQDPIKNEKRLVKITNKLIYKAIKKLDKKLLWFVELGIYIKYEDYFKDLFDKVILIRGSENLTVEELSKRKGRKILKNHPGLTADDSKTIFDELLINDGNLKEFKDKVLACLNTIN